MFFEVYNDPFGKYALPLPGVVRELFIRLGFPALIFHLHEILFLAAAYTVIYNLSPFVSPLIWPQYRELTPRNRINFDMHVVSHIQAIYLCAISFPLFGDKNLTSVESYTPYAGFVIASAVGYFVWDTVVCIKHRRMFGMGFVAHGVAALLTFSQGMRPFLHNVAAPFIWFEASTPFVNVHWFATHVPGMVSENTQFLNGLALILVFFLARVVSGPYNGYYLFKEIYTKPPTSVPFWAVVLVMATYTILTSLNMFWFTKMIRTAVKTFSKVEAKSAKPASSPSTLHSAAASFSGASSGPEAVPVRRSRKA